MSFAGGMRPPAVAAIGVAIVVLALSCGGGGGIPDDPRVLEIGALAENATYALRDFGPSVVYKYLAPEVRDRCSLEKFVQALEGEPAPLGFQGLKKVKLEDGEAQVTVVWIIGAGTRDVEWVFEQDDEGQWQVLQLPGAEECG